MITYELLSDLNIENYIDKKTWNNPFRHLVYFAFDEELREIQNRIKEIGSNHKLLSCDILRSLQIERPTLDNVGRNVCILPRS